MPLDTVLKPPLVFTRPRIRIKHAGSKLGAEARLLWLAVFVFVAVSFWWLTQDNRIPDFDSGLHMSIANADRAFLASGHLLEPFTTYNSYPPLVHLLGALTIFIFGVRPMALTMASNVVFVPLLAFGCYGVGTIAGGRRAGLLAGLLGLTAPMFVSMMHNFDLDPAEAAMVAVSVWGLLASRRFERPGISALAGALCGLALLTKESAVAFLVGPILVMLVRGGWRNWRGLILFVFVLENVAGPWYVYHFTELKQSFGHIGQLYVNGVQSPPRGSFRNFGWYFWDLVNNQVLLPVTIAFLIGTAIAVWRSLRSLRTESVLPELLVGGMVSYLAMTYLTHKDPRYTLPALVYVAVLGTFWIPAIPRRRLRVAVTGAVVAISLVNFAGMAFGIAGTRRIMVALPGAQASMIFPHQLTLYENWGWLRGGPQHDGDVLGLLQALHRRGINSIALDPSANEVDFSSLGIVPVANDAGTNVTLTPAPSRSFAWLLLHTPRRGEPAPCQRLNDGSGVYVVFGPFAGLNASLLRDPTNSSTHYTFICPGRPPVTWPAVVSSA